MAHFGDKSVYGDVADGYGAVMDALQFNVDRGYEAGVGFAARVDGELVVDIWSGAADRWGKVPWRRDTMVNLFSTSKAACAMVVALLVEDGALDYEQPIADIWLDFAGRGREKMTLAQVLSHQSGLAGLLRDITPNDWYDHDKIVRLLLAQDNLWKPGKAHGYHPVTFGVILQEIVTRATGKSIGAHLRERLCEAHDVDVHIGMSPELQARCGDVMKPPAPPNYGELTEMRRIAFLANPTPGGRAVTSEEWRAAELPAVNGHGTASGLARMMDLIANDGRLDGELVLSAATLDAAMKERVCGKDLVLPVETSWAAGFLRNHQRRLYGPNPDTVGHSGWGGSFCFGDRTAGVAVGYVMNQMSEHIIGDPRGRRLVDAVYLCL